MEASSWSCDRWGLLSIRRGLWWVEPLVSSQCELPGTLASRRGAYSCLHVGRLANGLLRMVQQRKVGQTARQLHVRTL